jgi:hypothetical protein
MTDVASRPTARRISAALATALLAVTACSSLKARTAQSIAGVQPSGTVSVTEDFITGVGGGTGTLNFQGQDYPLRLIGAVAGPGGDLSKITASGEVYKLAKVTDFSGRYTQSTGAAGVSTAGASDLWLGNGAGVIMHLKGTSTGAMLTLGRDEIYITMNRQ